MWEKRKNIVKTLFFSNRPFQVSWQNTFIILLSTNQRVLKKNATRRINSTNYYFLLLSTIEEKGKNVEIGALSVEPDCIGDSHRGEGNAKGEREGMGKGKPLQTDENEEGELANTMEGDKEVRWHYFYF